MRNIFYIIILSIAFYRIYSFDAGFENGDRVRIRSQVLKEPNIYEDVQLIHVKGLYAYIPRYPEIKYGDKITIVGTVNQEKLDDAIIEEIHTGGGIFGVRNKLVDNFAYYLPDRHAGIMAGVTLGSKQLISSQFWEDLKNTGTAHVVVASGTNITFTIALLMSVLVLFINRKKAILFAIAGAWLYVLLSGFDAPLVRAAIMGTIAFSAQFLGRVNSALKSLAISAVIMVIVNPLWLSDLGFGLSFAATTSLIVFEPYLNRLLSFVPGILRQDLSTTIAAQIGVTPILFYTFGYISLWSPITNSLLLWTIPPIMIIGALSSVVGLVSLKLGQLIALMAYPFTSWFLFIISIF